MCVYLLHVCVCVRMIVYICTYMCVCMCALSRKKKKGGGCIFAYCADKAHVWTDDAVQSLAHPTHRSAVVVLSVGNGAHDEQGAEENIADQAEIAAMDKPRVRLKHRWGRHQ